MAARIGELVLLHPAYRCDHIEALPALEGLQVLLHGIELFVSQSPARRL